MTKNELIELFRVDMMNSLKLRDRTNACDYSEEYGYHHGQYLAYENVIKMLTMFDIEEVSPGDTRIMIH